MRIDIIVSKGISAAILFTAFAMAGCDTTHNMYSIPRTTGMTPYKSLGAKPVPKCGAGEELVYVAGAVSNTEVINVDGKQAVITTPAKPMPPTMTPQCVKKP